MKQLLVLIVLVLILTANEAASYSRLGAGTASCGAWTAFRHEGSMSARALSSEQWVLGFIDGITEESGGTLDPFNGVEAWNVWEWIDNYCQANPLKSIAEAASAFIAAHPR